MNDSTKKICGTMFHNIVRRGRYSFEAWHQGYHFVIERVHKHHYDVEVHDPRHQRIVNTALPLGGMEAAIRFALQEAGLTSKTPPPCPPSPTTTLTQTST